MGFPLTGNEEDDEEKLLRQAIALSLEGTEEADKEDEELLKQATVSSFDGAEKNDNEDDDKELLTQCHWRISSDITSVAGGMRGQLRNLSNLNATLNQS